MEEKTGVARLRQAITNQAACGSGQFELSIDGADRLCREIEDQLESPSWAEGIPAPVDADGEVVPLDTEVLYREDDGKCKVAYWAYYPNEKESWTAVSDVMGTKRACIPKTLHLTPPDSWEKLEKDVSKAAGKDICGYFGIVLSEPCSAECPARGVHDSCAVTAVRDVMRRAKALSERDAKAHAGVGES